MRIKTYDISKKLTAQFEREMENKSIMDYEKLQKVAPTETQLNDVRSFMKHHSIENHDKPMTVINFPQTSLEVFEIILLAASSDESGATSPWWDFDTIINDTFQLVVYSSNIESGERRVDFEINALPQKEHVFKSYFSPYKGTKRGIRVFWAMNQKQIALEGEIVHSLDGESVSGNGYVLSSEQFSNEEFKLMLEFYPIVS